MTFQQAINYPITFSLAIEKHKKINDEISTFFLKSFTNVEFGYNPLTGTKYIRGYHNKMQCVVSEKAGSSNGPNSPLIHSYMMDMDGTFLYSGYYINRVMEILQLIKENARDYQLSQEELNRIKIVVETAHAINPQTAKGKVPEHVPIVRTEDVDTLFKTAPFN